jgi:hypothetical protein
MAKMSLLKRALRILDEYQIWWTEWDDVRELVLAGKNNAAKKTLVDEHELEPKHADHLVDWLNEAIQGKKVELIEIQVSDIHYPAADEFSDDEDDIDPFERPRYLARYGVDIAYMNTVGMAKSKSKRKVMFKGRTLKAKQLHQIWEIRVSA